MFTNNDEYGTEVEIQLPPKRLPDYGVSSLIRAGWCEEGIPATKNSLQHSHGWTTALWRLNRIFSKWKRHYD